jgi:hypothetical protein
MASIIFNVMRKHRFHPEFGIKGETIGISKIDVAPDGPLDGPGWIHLTALFSTEFVTFLQKKHPEPLCIGLFGDQNERDKRAMTLLLDGVLPSGAHLDPFTLDAASADILTITVKLRYEGMRFILGDSPLSFLAAVADEGQK